MKPTLGQYLGSIRKDRKFTLREVEEATDREVSNAYLSQIENDKIKKPSPNILHRLSELYAIDFAKLMDLAGYITPASSRSDAQRHSRVATFAEHNLTPNEESQLLEYLQFLRQKKNSD